MSAEIGSKTEGVAKEMVDSNSLAKTTMLSREYQTKFPGNLLIFSSATTPPADEQRPQDCKPTGSGDSRCGQCLALSLSIASYKFPQTTEITTKKKEVPAEQ